MIDFLLDTGFSWTWIGIFAFFGFSSICTLLSYAFYWLYQKCADNKIPVLNILFYLFGLLFGILGTFVTFLSVVLIDRLTVSISSSARKDERAECQKNFVEPIANKYNELCDAYNDLLSDYEKLKSKNFDDN